MPHETPPPTPEFDHVLAEAMRGLGNEDVALFFGYFDELKRHVRAHLGRKARLLPGESAIAQSALFSMLCDLAAHQLPLHEIDEEGYPAFWPLLLKYLERHCNKWNAWYRAKKRRATEVPLGNVTDAEAPGIDPEDYRSGDNDSIRVGKVCEELLAHLTGEESLVFELWCQGSTLADSAARLDCSEAKISYVRERIRRRLLGL